jgi:hypothetical protein
MIILPTTRGVAARRPTAASGIGKIAAISSVSGASSYNYTLSPLAQPGDIVLFLFGNNSTMNPTNAGWSSGFHTYDLNSYTGGWAFRLLTGAEPSSGTFTNVGANAGVWQIVWRGATQCRETNYVNGANGNLGASASTSITKSPTYKGVLAFMSNRQANLNAGTNVGWDTEPALNAPSQSLKYQAMWDGLGTYTSGSPITFTGPGGQYMINAFEFY